MFKTIINFIKNLRKSDEELYLEAAADHADFEYRMKRLDTGLTYPYKLLPLYFTS